MKKHPADTLTAAGFLLFTALMLLLALLHLSNMSATIRTAWVTDPEPTQSATLLDKAVFAVQHGEAALNQVLDPKHAFIQIYGGAQRLMGRRFVQDAVPENSVVKLDTGALNFLDLSKAAAGDPPDAAAQVQTTAELSAWLEQRNIPFLAVTAPQKIASGAQLPSGLTDVGNPAADAFLAGLAGLGVDTLDLRPGFDERQDRSLLFFRTDHHWRPEGAFFAFQLLSEELSRRYSFPSSAQALDPDNYDWSTLPDFFLGSQGKRVGSLYAGVDDFTVVSPLFPTSFTYTTPYETRQGSFQQALCFPQFIQHRDYFGLNPYTYYSGGDYGLASVENHNNPQGPRILLIRESFSCALAPFLALNCSTLTTVDPRQLDQPLSQVVEQANPDLVLLLYSASSTANERLFSWELS